MTAGRFSSTVVDMGSFASSRKFAAPYDATLAFNKVVDAKEGDPGSITYSINPTDILNALDAEHFDKLLEITLAARMVRDGSGIWDTLFNSANDKAMNACIFVADADFKPLHQNRVAKTAQFLNYSMPVTRSHLNQVIKGDRIGIAIHDITKEKRWILLYTIQDMCFAPSTNVVIDGRPSLIPALNVKLEHFLVVAYDGKASVYNINEDQPLDTDKAMPFVGWLTDTVDDVNTSYAWKPHFLPTTISITDRVAYDERIAKQIEIQPSDCYDEFETACRTLYRSAKIRNSNVNDQSNNKKKRDRLRPGARARHEYELPGIEVVTLPDRYVVKLDNQTGRVFCFAKEDMRAHQYVETFLTNQDIDLDDLIDCDKIVLLPKATFGDVAFVRYFTLNF